MADRCVVMQTEGACDHYLWDCGVVVTFNRETRQWTKLKVPHPAHEMFDAVTPNRELAPEVCDD